MQKRGLRIFGVIVLLISGCTWMNSDSKQLSPKALSFLAYVSAEERYLVATQLVEQKAFKESNNELTKIKNVFSVQSKVFALLASNHFDLDNKDSCIFYLSKAFDSGLELCRIRPEFYPTIWDSLVSTYPNHFENYLATLDLEIREQLYRLEISDQAYRNNPDYVYKLAPIDFNKVDSVDSSNIQVLYQIVDKVGWPGRGIIGPHGANHDSNCYFDQIPANPSLLVLHSEEIDTKYFLKACFKAVVSGKATWDETYRVKQGLLWRFSLEGYDRYSELTFNSRGELDILESAFELRSIAAQMTKNKFPLLTASVLKEIYPDRYIPDIRKFHVLRHKNESKEQAGKYLKALRQLKETLITYGVPEQTIFISDSLLTFPSQQVEGVRIVSKKISDG